MISAMWRIDMDNRSANEALNDFFKKQKEEIEKSKIQESPAESQVKTPEQEWELLMAKLINADNWEFENISHKMIDRAKQLMKEHPGRFKCPHPAINPFSIFSYVELCGICGEPLFPMDID